MIILPEDKAVIALLPPEDAQILLLALFSEEDDMPDFSPLAQMAYTVIKTRSDRISKAQSENGRRGGAPKGNRNARKQPEQASDEETTQNNPNNPDQPKQASVTVSDSGTVSDSVTVTKREDLPPSSLSSEEATPIVADTAKPKKSRRKKSSEEMDPFFMQFWELYPLKKNRPGAAKAWARLNVDEALLKRILDGVRRHLSSAQWQDSMASDGGKFVPHPTTFLNQRRWEDEVPTVAQYSINGSRREPKSGFAIGSISQSGETPDERKARFDRLVERPTGEAGDG